MLNEKQQLMDCPILACGGHAEIIEKEVVEPESTCVDLFIQCVKCGLRTSGYDFSYNYPGSYEKALKIETEVWQAARAKPLPDAELQEAKQHHRQLAAECEKYRATLSACYEKFYQFFRNGKEYGFKDAQIKDAETLATMAKNTLIETGECAPDQPPAPLPYNKEVGELVELIDKIIWGIDHCSTKHSIIAKCEQLKSSLTITSQPPAISDDVVGKIKQLCLSQKEWFENNEKDKKYAEGAINSYIDILQAIAAMDGK